MRTLISHLRLLIQFSGSLALVACLQADLQAQEKHVLVIGIDGVRSDALVAANTPSLDGLAAVGALSLDAFSGGPVSPSSPAHQATSSGPGWSSILTGVWVDKHGVSSNGNFVNGNFSAYPHFFKRVRDAVPGAELTSVVQWHPINQNLLDPFPGLANIAIEVANSGQAVENAAVNQLQNANPDALFVHFDDVDHAGHGSGFNVSNPAYLQAIEETDTHIGNLLTAIQNRPNVANEDWLVVATTDHGGNGTSHGAHSVGERTIWIIASGGQAVNATFSPGPGHTIVVPTALLHLGIAIDPSWELDYTEAFGAPVPKASLPVPADAEQEVGLEAELTWLPGADALSSDVYFGTDPFIGAGQFVGNVSGSNFDPGTLAEDTGYFWRVDTVTGQGVEVGNVWSFVTAGSLLDDLVVRLEFEGDTLDASGQSNHAAAFGNPAFVPGIPGQGLALDGSGDFLDLGLAPDLDFGHSTDFSVAFWVQSNGWGSDPVFLSNKNWASGANTGWIIAGETDGSSWQWNFKGSSAPRFDFDNIAPIGDAQWHHLAVTHDRDGQAVFFQDGVQLGAIQIAGAGNVDSGLPTAIAQDGTLTYPTEMPAIIDGVGIWRRVLGPSEIQALVANGFPTALGTNYCEPTMNGSGKAALITAAGSSSLSDNNLELRATQLPANQAGLFFFGLQPAQIPFGDGVLCVGGPLARLYPLQFSGSAGVVTRTLDLTVDPFASFVSAGTTTHFQYWFRDMAAPSGFNLTNGVTLDWQ